VSTRPTPPLSREGVDEITTEMANPPADTPERRATLDRARDARFLVEQVMTSALPRKKQK
jgi:hypothetical protein